jgi:hypothetical protein
MDSLTIIAELEYAIAGIHPAMGGEAQREARKAMIHALEFIKERRREAQAVRDLRRSALARKSDPETSKAAAEADMSKMERAVYSVIGGYANAGCTQDDLLASFPSHRSQSVTPRIARLIEKGFVEKTGETRTGKSGRQQAVIRATGGDARMMPGTIVRDSEGRIGVVESDQFGCCDEGETMVVFDGTDCGSGTQTADLTVVGEYSATPDAAKCGAGHGEKCCIYLVCGAQGFECARFSSLRMSLIFKTMNAKRRANRLFPACMDLEADERKGGMPGC